MFTWKFGACTFPSLLHQSADNVLGKNMSYAAARDVVVFCLGLCLAYRLNALLPFGQGECLVSGHFPPSCVYTPKSSSHEHWRSRTGLFHLWTLYVLGTATYLLEKIKKKKAHAFEQCVLALWNSSMKLGQHLMAFSVLSCWLHFQKQQFLAAATSIFPLNPQPNCSFRNRLFHTFLRLLLGTQLHEKTLEVILVA